MKVILTAGHELSGFEQVHQALTSAGVAQAQLSKRDALSINTLQQNILTVLDVDTAAAGYQLKPGKMWQDLAADILLGNLEQKMWGHADTHTLWLLDFWKNLDTQTHFVLVYNSPTQVIVNALARNLSPQAIGAVLNKWKSDNTELLHFYHRNKDRALLVHINSAINSASNPKSKNSTTNAFIHCVNENFGVGLSDVGQQAIGCEQASELASLIADQAMIQYADLMDCYHELESAADLPSQADGSISISVEKACAEFAAFKTAQENSIAAAQVQADIQQHNLFLSGELESLTAERDLLILQQQTQASLIKAEAEKIQEIRQLKEKITHLEKSVSPPSEVNAAQEKLVLINKSLTEENEILLLQVRQLQEELESYYLKYKTLMQGNASLKSIGDLSIASFQKECQPEQAVVDLRKDFSGDNWYDPEPDGVWAGPALKSTLKIPALSKGEYAMTFVVADAMDIDIISTMAISLNGVPLTLNINQLDYPVNVTAHINTDLLPHDSIWLFELTFAKNVSPANCDPNNEDHRFLAIKLQQLILSSNVTALTSPAIKPVPEIQPLTVPVSAAAEPVLSLNQFTVNMNEPITGNNWYDPEVDGRWAGPGTLSTVIMPGLVQGQYDIDLDVVDTIEPDVLAGMEMLINGSPVPLSFDWSQFPTPITARFSSEQTKAEWELSFRFPRTVSPAEQSPANQDHRKLAVRVQSIAFTPV